MEVLTYISCMDTASCFWESPSPKQPYYKVRSETLHFRYLKFLGQFITTSADLTPNGGLVRESPQNPRNIQV